MKYSFKKHILNDYYSLILFIISIVIFIIFVLFLLISIIHNYILSKEFNLDFIKIFFVLPIISLFCFINLIIKIYETKDFIKNCFEIDAKIEKYLAYYGKYNDTYEDGTETAILITFSYEYNNSKYRTRFSISNNKHTKKYFNNYKEYGETVKILINKRKPWRMKIKEMYY